MKKSFSIMFFILNILIFGQNAKILPTYAFPKIISSISMPMKISLREISNLVNSSVKVLIYDDNSYSDNNNNHFKLEVFKLNPA